MAFAVSPPLPDALFGGVMKLLFRCTHVGGSTTLITRCAVLAWIASWLQFASHEALKVGRLKALIGRMQESSDKERIGQWSGGHDACPA